MKEVASSTCALPMMAKDIEKYIPHRYPFMFLDQITDYKPGVYIQALKCISASDSLLQGHFPGNPVVPGVVMVESMAQASAVLGKLTQPEIVNTCLLMEIERSRFRRLVVPGEVMTIEVNVTKSRKSFFWFAGEVRVDGAVAATATFSAKLA